MNLLFQPLSDGLKEWFQRLNNLLPRNGSFQIQRGGGRRSHTTLDAIQQAAQSQFSKQSQRYGHGHILENVEDAKAATETIGLSPGSRVLDVATGAGHSGLYFASLGHDVTLADISTSM